MTEGTMPNFGYHAVYEQDFSSSIRTAAEFGFQYVQFDLNVPSFYIDKVSRRQIRDINSIAAALGVAISFHAPGDNVSLFTDYPLIRKGLLDHFKLILQKANELGAHHLTIHPLNPPSFRRADTLEDSFQTDHQEYFKQVLKENLKQLTDEAGPMVIVVENCQFRSIAVDTLTEMFQEGTDIFLALDWAKMHNPDLTIDQQQGLFFTNHRARIRELHLHDMDCDGRSHLRPGQGALDFSGLFDEYYDPSQWLTLEVRPAAEAAKAKASFMETIQERRGT